MSEIADSEIVVHHDELFGPAIAELRGRAEWSQADLADRAGLHRSYLSALENGRSNTALRSIMRALRALDMEVVIRPRGRR